eukprot:s47_g5.t2
MDPSIWCIEVSGSKMVVMAAIGEIMEHFGVNGLAEARDRFQTLAAADLPDPASGFLSEYRQLHTLCAGFLRTGDVLYMPMGYMIVEKCMVDTSLAIRTGY